MLYKNAIDNICCNIKQKEKYTMSDKCSLKNIEIEDLALYELQSRVINAIRIISDINSDSCERSARVIKIAALLPKLAQMEKLIALAESQIHRDMQVVKLENTHYLADTVNTMKGAYSLLMQKDPHTHEVELIEALGEVTEIHVDESRQRGWKERLLQTLLDNDKLKENTATWINNFESIKKLIEVFDLPKEELNQMIGNTLKNDTELSKIDFWIDNREKIKELIEFFNLSKENIQKMLISVLTSDERMKNLDILITYPDILKELIKTFSLPEEKVQAIIVQQIRKNLEYLSKTFDLETVYDIKSRLETLLERNFISKCINSIKIMNLNIDPTLYRDVVEEFIKEVNGYASIDLRNKTMRIAIRVYKTLKEEGFDIENREFILTTYNSENEHPTDKGIQAACLVLEYKYMKQNEDSWISRNLRRR